MGEACRVRGGSEKCVQNYDWKDRREESTRKTWTNVRITIKQAGRTNLAQDRDRWKAFVYMIMKLRVAFTSRNLASRRLLKKASALWS
jgi:hypothetical protein